MSCFSADTVSYKLYYFAIKGRAEATRLLFAIAGKEYEDIRIEFPKWPEHKPKAPQGTLPYLEFDGVKLPQSMAINRYLAEKFGLNGKSLWERTMIDVVCETLIDLRTKHTDAMFEKDEEKKAELLKKLEDETIPTYLGLLEDLLNKNQSASGFFVGNSVTLADVLVFTVLDFMSMKYPELLDKHSKLKANHQKFKNIEGVRNWLQKRPKSDM